MPIAATPRVRYLSLPTGGVLVATLLDDAWADDNNPLYEIQCVGQNGILQAFVDSIDDKKKRENLYCILDMDGSNPQISMTPYLDALALCKDGSRMLSANHAVAIIVHSRVSSPHGTIS